MKPFSLSKRIETYCKNHYPEKISGKKIEELTMQAGYKSSNGSRRCREMSSGKLSNGKTCLIVLKATEDIHGWVQYQYIPQETIISVPIFTESGTVRMEQRSLFK